MARWTLAGLLAELETALAWIRKSAGEVFRPSQPSAGPPEPGVTQFGEYERVEETKYFPPTPPAPPELGEAGLPERYGKTRLVLLAVDPYLVHAYWEVVPEEFDEAIRRLGPGPVVLRFHETTGAAPAGGSGGWFDVDVALEPGNWDVRMWSPDRSYTAELGLRSSDGGFVSLARSNVVRTPRTWPVAAVEERYMRVETVESEPASRAVPAPVAVKPPRPQTATAPVSAGALQSIGAPPSAGALESAGAPASSGTPASVGTPPPARIPAPFPAVSAGIRAASPPGGSADLLRQKLSELYAFREAEPEPPHPPDVSADAVPRSQPLEPGIDLTGAAEKAFSAGVSSPLLPERRPES